MPLAELWTPQAASEQGRAGAPQPVHVIGRARHSSRANRSSQRSQDGQKESQPYLAATGDVVALSRKSSLAACTAQRRLHARRRTWQPLQAPPACDRPRSDAGWRYGREIPLAVDPQRERGASGQGDARRRSKLFGDEWRGRGFPARRTARAATVFEERVLPLVPAAQRRRRPSGGWPNARGVLLAQADFSSAACSPPAAIPTGRSLHAPTERRKNYPACCQHCPQRPVCESGEPRSMTPGAGVAQARPHRTRRRADPARRHLQLFSTMAKVWPSPPRWSSRSVIIRWRISIYDLANLRAGHRFTPEGDNPHGGRLGGVGARVYMRADHPGYLEMGVPPDYGDGAAEAVREHERTSRQPQPPAQRPVASRRSGARADRMAQPAPARRRRRRIIRGTAGRRSRPRRGSSVVARVGAGGLPVFPPLSAAQQRRYQHRLFLKGCKR